MLTSYAQNFEDVILWRALRHVGRGFYVDIGAHDPIIDSVSLAFYENGWRGLHVEPCKLAAARLRAERCDEDILEFAVGTGESAATFYYVAGTGLSTCDAAIARQHARDGHTVEETQVDCVPLAEVLDRVSDREVHWLKIDVEGSEEAVIRSWAPSSVRPWIVVVESVHPHRRHNALPEWEGMLLSLGYAFVYFDGVNRFYVSLAHLELKEYFGPGPNVFDNFALSGSACAPFCGKLTDEIAAVRRQLIVLSDAFCEREAALLARCADLRAANAANAAAVASGLQTRDRESRALRRTLKREQSRLLALAGERDRLTARCKAVEADLARITEHRHALWVLADRLTHEVTAMRDSLSWRISAPLRRTKAFGRRAIDAVTRPIIRMVLVSVLAVLDGVLALVRRHTRLRTALLRIMYHWPGLCARLMDLASRRRLQKSRLHAQERSSISSGSDADELAALPASARQIYRELKTAHSLAMAGTQAGGRCE